MNTLQLRDLVRAVNNREQTIEQLSTRAMGSASDWLREIALQGADLIKIKTQSQGEWTELFESGAIKLTLPTAQKYVRVATKISELDESSCFRQAMLLLTAGDEGQSLQHEPKRWPDYYEAIGKLSKFVTFVERHSMDKWPAEGVGRLREQLLPVVMRLWPEKFEDPTRMVLVQPRQAHGKP